MPVTGFSIVICCYNSAERLPKTLKHIADQVLGTDTTFEVIIVDNNSSDNTGSIAKLTWSQYQKKNSMPLTVIREQKPGLSYARLAGVQDAKYDWIIFCDDDNWLKEDYLTIAQTHLSLNESIGALGGQGIGVADVSFPDWWEDYAYGFAVGLQAPESGVVDKRTFLWGAGMVTKRSLYLKAFPKGFPSFLTGRNGVKLFSGDDSEYCLRLLLMGYHLYYDERLIFHHYMPAARLTWGYKKQLFYGHEIADKKLEIYRKIIHQNQRKVWDKIINLITSPFSYTLYLMGLKKLNKSKFVERLFLDWQIFLLPCNPELKAIVKLQKKWKTVEI